MNFTEGLRTVLEIIMVCFTVWAVFNEQRFVKFERRIIAKIRRRRLKVINGNSSVKSTYIPACAKKA